MNAKNEQLPLIFTLIKFAINYSLRQKRHDTKMTYKCVNNFDYNYSIYIYSKKTIVIIKFEI